MDCNEIMLKRALAHLKVATTTLSKAKKKNPCKTNPRKRKKKRNTSSSMTVNPRVHFPKTSRGRKQVMHKWRITSAGKPPITFQATKGQAYLKAHNLVSSGKRKKLVLDGPK